MLEEMVAEANRRSEAYEAALEEAKQVQAELARKQELEARIEKRADILASLNAQPDWFNYVAAFAASCVSTLVMHPLDTLKTREVAGVEGGPGGADAGSSIQRGDGRKPPPQEEEGWSLEGYLSLYQGLAGALLKEGPPSAVYLGVYEAVKSNLLATPNFSPYPLLVYLIAGA